mmetsp:Transcript_30866/g.98493  ORF Transcript_30866/g.98493 Transcript_30866/m.98493 type:complete len:232 (-) Transcript_30866:1050-1745(-)
MSWTSRKRSRRKAFFLVLITERIRAWSCSTSESSMVSLRISTGQAPKSIKGHSAQASRRRKCAGPDDSACASPRCETNRDVTQMACQKASVRKSRLYVADDNVPFGMTRPYLRGDFRSPSPGAPMVRRQSSVGVKRRWNICDSEHENILRMCLASRGTAGVSAQVSSSRQTTKMLAPANRDQAAEHCTDSRCQDMRMHRYSTGSRISAVRHHVAKSNSAKTRTFSPSLPRR